jgi:hypothetical protein
MLQATTIPGAAATQDARIERAILSSQLQQLESSRRELQTQLQAATTPGDRAALTGQLADVTRRIAVVDNMIARTQGQLAGADAQATTEVPSRPQVIVQGGPPEDETLIAFGFFGLVLLLPMSIAMTRRMWRRTPPAAAAIPSGLEDRLARIEQAVEATALEVERIGEGQRFVTKILTEASSSARLPAAELTEKVQA